MSLGVKYRPHPFAIHLATSQLARLQRHNARCREIWNAIVGELQGARALAPVSTLPSATRGGYYAFVLSYDPEPGMPPLATVVERARAAGVPITTDPYAGRPLHRAPLFAAPDPAQRAHALLGSADARSHEASPADGTLPETERLAGRLLAFEHLMYLSSPSYARSCTRRLVDATGGRRPSRQGPAMQGLREEPTGGLGPSTSTHA
jgi:dTDP-4-amino-4,6-dideoxygalactose transaminase